MRTGSDMPVAVSGPGRSCVRGRDHRLDAAPHREVADDGHAAGVDGGDEVVEDLVGDVLVEDAAVSELDQVVLQRLQLDAQRVGDVGDPDLAEIGQPGLRADRRELGTADGDLVVALGPRVGEVSSVGLDMREKF